MSDRFFDILLELGRAAAECAPEEQARLIRRGVRKLRKRPHLRAAEAAELLLRPLRDRGCDVEEAESRIRSLWRRLRVPEDTRDLSRAALQGWRAALLLAIAGLGVAAVRGRARATRRDAAEAQERATGRSATPWISANSRRLMALPAGLLIVAAKMASLRMGADTAPHAHAHRRAHSAPSTLRRAHSAPSAPLRPVPLPDLHLPELHQADLHQADLPLPDLPQPDLPRPDMHLPDMPLPDLRPSAPALPDLRPSAPPDLPDLRPSAPVLPDLRPSAPPWGASN
jgi:hypothetical protein